VRKKKPGNHDDWEVAPQTRKRKFRRSDICPERYRPSLNSVAVGFIFLGTVRRR